MNHSSDRVFGVIEAVSAASEPLTLEQIAGRAGLSRATAYRLIDAMCESGILLREPRRTGFSPGPRLAAIVLGLACTQSLQAVRHRILEGLVSRIGETCNFTTLHEGQVLYVDRVEADWPASLKLRAGSSTPLHCTSSGKLYLSQMPAKHRLRLLRAQPIPRFTDKTNTDPDALEAELKSVRKRRVAFDDEGFLDGLVSAAVPVFGLRRSVIGTVSVHGPAQRLPMNRARSLVPELRRAAALLTDAYRTLNR